MLLYRQMPWNRTNRWITVIGLVVAILALIAVWLVVPEFRKLIGWEKPEGQSLPKNLTISGIVLDPDTKQGIGQATITFAGRTEQGVTEDSGNFSIDLSLDSPKRVRLHVNKSGFQPLDTSVEPPADNLVLLLQKQR